MSFPADHPSSSEDTQRFIMMVFTLVRDIEAIGWYEQQMAAEPSSTIRAVMQIAQKEEFKHLILLLQAMLESKPAWRGLMQQALFQDHPLLVELGEEAEYGPIH